MVVSDLGDGHLRRVTRLLIVPRDLTVSFAFDPHEAHALRETTFWYDQGECRPERTLELCSHVQRVATALTPSWHCYGGKSCGGRALWAVASAASAVGSANAAVGER